MIKIAVCDDDRTVRESIVKALRRYERENEMEFEVLEYAAADTMLISYPADLDLILLDITCRELMVWMLQRQSGSLTRTCV